VFVIGVWGRRQQKNRATGLAGINPDYDTLKRKRAASRGHYNRHNPDISLRVPCHEQQRSRFPDPSPPSLDDAQQVEAAMRAILDRQAQGAELDDAEADCLEAFDAMIGAEAEARDAFNVFYGSLAGDAAATAVPSPSAPLPDVVSAAVGRWIALRKRWEAVVLAWVAEVPVPPPPRRCAATARRQTAIAARPRQSAAGSHGRARQRRAERPVRPAPVGARSVGHGPAGPAQRHGPAA
jgi:hypothetical protein